MTQNSEFERSRKMTWLDFISNMGGVCGLCLGISFVSVIEFIFWFTVRLCAIVLGTCSNFTADRVLSTKWLYSINHQL